tara:strand:+ start:116 stop:403 length:288 start_codon:yes stop_codon:yes gene_type:complete
MSGTNFDYKGYLDNNPLLQEKIDMMKPDAYTSHYYKETKGMSDDDIIEMADRFLKVYGELRDMEKNGPEQLQALAKPVIDKFTRIPYILRKITEK